MNNADIQTSIAWKPDGQHVAIGLFNRSIMTFYVGDLRQSRSINGGGEAKMEE